MSPPNEPWNVSHWRTPVHAHQRLPFFLLTSSPAPRTWCLAPWIRDSAYPTCPRGNSTSVLTSAPADILLGAGRGLSRFLRRRGTWGRFRYLAFPSLSVPSDISYSRVRSLNALAGTTAGRPESKCWGHIVWSVRPAAAARRGASSPRVAPPRGRRRGCGPFGRLSSWRSSRTGTRRGWRWR